MVAMAFGVISRVLIGGWVGLGIDVKMQVCVMF